ncbi:MAG: sugar-binding transcriptional regulator [Patescibacteria group bacterium]
MPGTKNVQVVSGLTAEEVAALQARICPEAGRLCLGRYDMLRAIHFGQPIGRRALAERLHLQERRIRRELALLASWELVRVDGRGVALAADGEATLWQLEAYIRILRGLSRWENQLCRRYGLREAIVVPGDADRDETVKKELARVTADYLRARLVDGAILAVTGGTTLAEVALALRPAGTHRDLLVLPARGGLGEEVELQANTVAAAFAKGLGGSYRMLHVPDEVGPETLQSMANEPKVREVIELMRRADFLLHGIGVAGEMARRRGMKAEDVEALLEAGAVGEALGYYFAADGRLVHTTSSVGLQDKDLASIPNVVMVGGGRGKAGAAGAILKHGGRQVVITDEAVARALLRESP